MTWRVLIREATEADIREIYSWYESQRNGLGDAFLVSIADALARIEAGPEQLPFYYRGFRRLLTARFPYRIFFRTEQDTVIIFRILHVARDHPRHLR